MKFKLLAGGHAERTPGSGGRVKQKHYRKGDVIESDTDLEARFGSTKFQRIHEAEKPAKSKEKEPSKSVLEQSNEGAGTIEDEAGFESAEEKKPVKKTVKKKVKKKTKKKESD